VHQLNFHFLLVKCWNSSKGIWFLGEKCFLGQSLFALQHSIAQSS